MNSSRQLTIFLNVALLLSTGCTSEDEAGSGANTPVNNLAATTEFWLAPLNASISGTIFDVSTGRVATAAKVSLYVWAYDEDPIYVDSVTTTTGAYSFPAVMPNMDYALEVDKTGYVYADRQPDDIGEFYREKGFVEIWAPIGCGMTQADIDVYITYNPDRDTTIPFIASIYADDEEVIDDSAIDYQVQAFAVTFSEAMKQASVASMKHDYAVTISDNIVVTVTATTQGTATYSGGIIDDYTLAWASSGTVLRIIPTYLTEAEIIDAVGFDDDDTLGGADTYSFAYVGEYHIAFDEYNTFLTDLNNIPWAMDDYDGFYINPLGAAYQNNFIFWNGNGNLEVYTEF